MDKEISEGRLGWLAGMIDGEGSISISKLSKRPTIKIPYPIYCLSINITNTEKELLSPFLESFGGNIKPYYNKNNSSAYQWTLNGNKAINILNTIKKYIESNRKKELIKIAIEFQSKQTNTGNKRTQKRIDEQEEAYQKAKELNKRGKRNPNIKPYEKPKKDTMFLGVNMEDLE